VQNSTALVGSLRWWVAPTWLSRWLRAPPARTPDELARRGRAWIGPGRPAASRVRLPNRGAVAACREGPAEEWQGARLEILRAGLSVATLFAWKRGELILREIRVDDPEELPLVLQGQLLEQGQALEQRSAERRAHRRGAPRFADEIVDGTAQRIRKSSKHMAGWQGTATFVVCDHPIGDARASGQLSLSETCGLTAREQPLSEVSLLGLHGLLSRHRAAKD